MTVYKLRDRSGVPLHDANLAIPMGAIDGVSVINKFGAAPSAPADTSTDVWDGGGTYSFPATALMTSLSQTTDQVALRGALINIQGLDENWEPITQIVALDATLTTNVVTLPTPLLRCYRMILMGSTAGDSSIRVHNAAETVDYAIITAGVNQTLMAIYTIPAGYTGFMTTYYTSVTNQTGRIPTSTEILIKAANNAHSPLLITKHAQSIAKEGDGVDHNFHPYYKFTEKTDILMNVVCGDQEGHVHGGFDIILVANTHLT